MNVRPTRIFPLGDNAITVEFGNELSVRLNDAAVGLADHFNRNPFPGFVEAVPAMASATIFYRSYQVETENDATAFDKARELIVTAVEAIASSENADARVVSVPISFNDEDALDLDFVAEHARLKKDEVVDIFLSKTYRVFMLGFLPGFAYMGIVDERIATPRLAAPRLSVPKGSVGIAGRQTGIYPAESPGGWQIIGHTNIEPFDPKGDRPTFFQPGDNVRFVRSGT